MLAGLSLLKNLLLEIDDIYTNFTNDITDKMDLIRKEAINKPKSVANDYIDDEIESDDEQED